MIAIILSVYYALMHHFLEKKIDRFVLTLPPHDSYGIIAYTLLRSFFLPSSSSKTPKPTLHVLFSHECESYKNTFHKNRLITGPIDDRASGVLWDTSHVIVLIQFALSSHPKPISPPPTNPTPTRNSSPHLPLFLLTLSSFDRSFHFSALACLFVCCLSGKV